MPVLDSAVDIVASQVDCHCVNETKVQVLVLVCKAVEAGQQLVSEESRGNGYDQPAATGPGRYVARRISDAIQRHLDLRNVLLAGGGQDQAPLVPEETGVY